MSMIFYGAGNRGKEALTIYCREYDDGGLRGFADSNKTGEYCGYPVISISEADRQNTDVVITVKDFQVVTEVYYLLKREKFAHIYWFLQIGKKKEGDSFLERECIDCSLWGEVVLPSVEMHLADYCNLNCKGCTHFSPLFEKELPDFEERIQDVRMLIQKVSHIVRFSLLGGEPFLNSEIARYITEIRGLLPDTYIEIVTNGLLIPSLSEDIMTCIAQNGIAVSISEYEPTHRIIDRIEEILNAHGIIYEIRRYEHKQKFIKPLSVSGKSRYQNRCISDGCVNIWNGKIARCPTLMYIDRFNQKFHQNLPDDGIMQLSGCPDGLELLNILKREVPLCRHCIGCEVEWEQCNLNPALTDFAAMD